MNTVTNRVSIEIILIISMILAWFLATSAGAYYIEQECQRLYKPIESMCEQIFDLCDRLDCIRYLRTNDLVKKSVTDEDLELYITMAKQNSDGDTHVYPALILAVIAVESNFDTNAYSSAGARGLMQLMPVYHTSSLSQFKGSPASRDDFFTPEWNVAAGTTYLSQLIEQSLTHKNINDSVGFALMCYNQGPVSASSTYFGNGRHLSSYAKKVLSIANDLQEILSRGDVYRAKT